MKTIFDFNRIAATVLALGLSFHAVAEIRDTTLSASLEYKEELGYFQKANRDLGDPIFMLYDAKAGLDFGIGGSVRARSAYDFFGSLESGTTFNPAMISVPTDYSNTFWTAVSGSEIHVKARYHMKDHKVIAFLKFGGGSTNSVSVSEAYVSIDGFSCGLIPSFFMDLEVGYLMTGAAVSSPVKYVHPLFGYKRKFGEHWLLGVSAESPTLSLPGWLAGQYGLAPDNQAVPDLTFHAKYRWKSGHIQLGTLLRNIKYWSYNPNAPVSYQYSALGITGYELGYGLSLTGNQRLNRMVKLSAEFVYGKGISRYLELFNNQISDLGMCNDAAEDGLFRMKALPVLHGVLAAQIDWSEKFTSTVLFSYAKSFEVDGVSVPNFNRNDFTRIFESGMTANANLFWHISPNAYAGIEAMFGHSHLRNTYLLPDDHGTLARTMISFAFMF